MKLVIIVGNIKLANACSIGIKTLNPVINIIGKAKPTIPFTIPAINPIIITINNIRGSFIRRLVNILKILPNDYLKNAFWDEEIFFLKILTNTVKPRIK